MRIELQNYQDSTIDKNNLLNRGEMFGDGFFTTGVIINGQIAFKDAHVARLESAATQLAFKDFSLSDLQSKLDNIENTCYDDCTFRISVCRNQSSRGYKISEKATSYCKIDLFPLVERPKSPCELLIARIHINHNPSLAGIKHLNRLDSVLASSEIESANQEALMLDGDKLICGSRSNLFVLINGIWLTDKLDSCGILGITRQRVLDYFVSHDIPHKQTEIRLDDIPLIKAAFVTNSLIGAWPAKSIHGRSLSLESSQQISEFIN